MFPGLLIGGAKYKPKSNALKLFLLVRLTSFDGDLF